MHQAVADLAPHVGVARACAVLGVPRSTYYRQHPATTPADHPPTTLAEPTSSTVPASARRGPALLRSDRFVDQAPREVYATVLDEGPYGCSWATLYRLLRQVGARVRRRDHPRRHAYQTPALLATPPHQRWRWAIPRLKGPTTWTYCYLYGIIDVFSRYVVGWMLATRETAELAEAFIAATGARERIAPGQLTVHADRGSALTAKDGACLLADLGVAQSHRRPPVSNDNPFSEAQFKTAT